jgi:hypothetical protein
VACCSRTTRLLLDGVRAVGDTAASCLVLFFPASATPGGPLLLKSIFIYTRLISLVVNEEGECTGCVY